MAQYSCYSQLERLLEAVKYNRTERGKHQNFWVELRKLFLDVPVGQSGWLVVHLEAWNILFKVKLLQGDAKKVDNSANLDFELSPCEQSE